jgi:hypothetical protein
MDQILIILGLALVGLIQLATTLYENDLWPFRLRILPRAAPREEVEMTEIPEITLPEFHYSKYNGLWALIATPDGGAKSMYYHPRLGWINQAGFMEYSWEGHAISPLEVEAAIGSEAYQSLFEVPRLSEDEWYWHSQTGGYANA